MILYYLFMIPAIILSLWASLRVKKQINKYLRVPSKNGLTGYQVAREILEKVGLKSVKIEIVNGFLSDHYDPSTKTLRLSKAIAQKASLASIGVAAHEAGHAIQHAKKYSPLIIRQTIAPLSKFSSWASYLFIIAGNLLSLMSLEKIGIILFSVAVVFSLVTLPVEFNASKRAKRLLAGYGLITKQESNGIDKVLNAAAMTYVAGAASSLMTLLYFAFDSD